MALFRSLLRSLAELHAGGTTAGPAARSIVAITNDYIARTHGRSNMFATVFLALLDPATGKLAWVNGGHEPPILRRRSGALERLPPTGPAVGALPNMEYTPRDLRLESGDLLLAFTDGVTEERSPAGTFYGEDRLLAVVSAGYASSAALLARIEAEVDAHRAGAERTDDLTMLAVMREGSA
jgi:sigma-B regulation protein RsbU (phosphoserine phosphatase)